MCRSQAQGGRRCPDARRLGTLTAAELAPHTPTAPELEWSHDDLRGLWESNPPEIACAAVKAVETASAADQRTFTDMTEATAEATGRLHGTEFRLKSPQSLARKITTKQEITETTGAHTPAEDIAATITDTTRYTTVCADHNQIVDTTVTTVTALRARGWHIAEAEHSYLPDNPYKGVHLLLRHDDGQIVELQVHSETSQQIKDRSHLLYEVARDSARSLSERREATEEGKALYAALPAPDGLETLAQRLGVNVSKKAYS